MAAVEGVLSALERNWEMVDGTLAGVDDAILARRPTDQCNSIAWLLWHMTRVVDTFVHTRLQAQPQVWIRDGWYAKFGMDPDPDNRGVGWTATQVAQWVPPTKDVQVGYYEAMKQATRAYLATLSDTDLEARRVIPPMPEPRTVAAALGQMTWDNVAHGGQIAYLRGLFQGMGWYSR
jgi:uncharacterized damage-inducible protein DinB